MANKKTGKHPLKKKNSPGATSKRIPHNKGKVVYPHGLYLKLDTPTHERLTKLKESGINISDHIRNLINNAKHTSKSPLSQEDRDIIKELTLYHNNVNQIAKSLNILGHYSSHDEDSLLEITKKIDELKVLLTEILSQLFDY